MRQEIEGAARLKLYNAAAVSEGVTDKILHRWLRHSIDGKRVHVWTVWHKWQAVAGVLVGAVEHGRQRVALTRGNAG